MSKNLTFSQRMGLEPVKVKIQIDSMDRELRLDLLNWILTTYLAYKNNPTITVNQLNELSNVIEVALWTKHLKQPLSKYPIYSWIEQELEKIVLKDAWNKVYELLEYFLNETPFVADVENLNQILEDGLSGYRFVGNKFIPLTSQQEIIAIESALDEMAKIKPVHIQLEKALEKLSDRENPDYRNSIKESISAVETFSKIIADEPEITLGKALSAIERQGKIELHTSLKVAFSSLYGWTTKDNGIRHALMDEDNLGLEDAIFMLVACSGFISYLSAKLIKAGIELDN